MPRFFRAGLLVALATFTAMPAFAENMTVEEFRKELVAVPLCGTPTSGPLAGKGVCTVHQPDGTAVVAGAGILVWGMWEIDNGRICRRNTSETPDKNHCVDYERLGKDRYRNSDGVEFCVGPCP
jgi:hypothetical protein